MPRNNDQRRDPNELGALWERETRKRDLMLSGEITCPGCGVSHDIVGLEIGSRNPKAPKWRIMKSTSEGGRGRDDRSGGYSDRGGRDDRDRDRDGGRGEYPSERAGSRRDEGFDRGRDDRRDGPRESPRYDDRDRGRSPDRDWTRDGNDRGGRGGGDI